MQPTASDYVHTEDMNSVDRIDISRGTTYVTDYRGFSCTAFQQ